MPNSPAEEQRINAIRFLAVDAVQKANSGHPGLPMGAAALAYTLWTRHLHFNPRDPHWLNRDRFVLSAGHGSMLLYALLYLTGYDLTLDDLKSFRQLGSKTPGHPEAERTAGSRGHDRTARTRRGQLRRNGHRAGASRRRLQPRRRGDRGSLHVLSLRRRRSHGRDQPRGNLAGGSPQARKADRLLRRQPRLARGTDRRRPLRRPDRALRSQRLAYAVHRRRSTATTSRRSITRSAWQRTSPTGRPSSPSARTSATGRRARTAISRTASRSGPTTSRSRRSCSAGRSSPTSTFPTTCSRSIARSARRAPSWRSEWRATYDAWKRANADLASQLERALACELPPNLPWPTFTAENGSVATRDAGGTVMNAIATALPELVGGSADLDPSTKTYLKNCGDFEPNDYAGRNIHYGVREHAMAAATNGISLHGGLLPFAATFFNFVDYLKPALRLACLTGIRSIYRLHARLGLPRRRRPDARADRAARDAARDAELLRDPARRFAGDARSVESSRSRARARRRCSCSPGRSCRSSALATPR